MDDPVRQSLDLLAARADGLIVNGVTFGTAPVAADGEFVRRLLDDARSALNAAREGIGRHDRELAGAAAPTLDGILASLEGMGASLLSLRDPKTLAPERVDALVADLAAAYDGFKRQYRELEGRCGVAEPHYERRPADLVERVDGFVNALPEIFANERARV